MSVNIKLTYILDHMYNITSFTCIKCKNIGHSYHIICFRIDKYIIFQPLAGILEILP